MPSPVPTILVFDSGLGGLTVFSEVLKVRPDARYVYAADDAGFPYGRLSEAVLAERVVTVMERLIALHDPDLVVVACNTAAAAALDELAADLPVPVVGVIEPGVRSLVKATSTGRVAVIGTVGTIGSGAYQRAVAETGAAVVLTCAACPGFVEFVEQGELRSEQVHVLAERLLAPVCAAEVDALLLGCTHYPFLARTITDVVGREVVLVSSADETAFEVRSLLAGSDRARDAGSGPGWARFLSSGDPCWFATLGRRLLGMELGEVAPVRWPR
jgi:glutamate racemase